MSQTGTSNGTGFCGQMKIKKKSFLAANTQDGFSTNKDNMYHTSTVKYTAVLFKIQDSRNFIVIPAHISM